MNTPIPSLPIKEPTPRIIALYIAGSVGIIALVLSIPTQMRWTHTGVYIVSVCVATFFLSLFFINFFLYRKIKLIYRTISTLKAQKFNEDVIQDLKSNDPLADVSEEVERWAEGKAKEIEQLKSMEKFRKEFLGNVAHELKTPIFNIQGYIHTLLDGAIDDKEMSIKFLGKAGKSADRLELLVKDLLNIAKLEAGAQELKIESIDVVELVQEIFENLEMRAKANNVRLEFKHHYVTPIYVDADRQLIRQAFVNLIVNSIKYGKNGGLTQISFYDLDTSYLIEVSDDGEGIDAKHLARLFERFYRIDRHRSREDGGTGLGLAIVKHAVEAHEQTVSVRSTLGLGSTFGFTLKKTKRNILQEVLEV